jgi:integrase
LELLSTPDPLFNLEVSRRSILTMENTEAFTVNQILDRFEADYIPVELGERTQRDYRRHVAHLRARFGTRIANDLKARDFRDFMDVRKGKIQRNKQLAVLSCAFSRAVGRWYMMDRNPCRDVERHGSKPRSRDVTTEEFEGFKATVPLRMQLAMQLSVLTGQRQGDVLSMKWTQIDRSKNTIRIHQSKTGKRLAIRITPTLSAVLERCAALTPEGEYVIRRRDGHRYTSDGFRAIWQRYMRRWAKLGHERFTYHDLRARAAGLCKTIEEAMLLLGHQNISMTRRVYDRIERVVDPAQ